MNCLNFLVTFFQSLTRLNQAGKEKNYNAEQLSGDFVLLINKKS